ncbi:hypothetical protein [Aquimarina sp. AU58]|uniref:hypothetical protein n=1 Tax=Aquimarina sp. AU58 TaxID=1874112 RepID=UPI000D642877|nr:hypothetical protein [Aquimarina sp. AU58]
MEFQCYQFTNFSYTSSHRSSTYFWKKLPKKTGEDLATKQNIEVITKKIEGVKADFVKETQFIKSELDLMNQNKFSLQSARRNALLKYYEDYSIWLNSISDVEVFFVDSYQEAKIEKLLGLINDFYNQYRLSKSRLGLFIDNKKFRNLIFELDKATIIHEQITRTFYVKLNGIDKKIFNNKKSADELEEYKELLKEKRELTKLFQSDSSSSFKEVLKYEVQIRDDIRKMLFDQIS